MLDLLAKLDPRDLYHAIGRDRTNGLEKLVQDNSSEENPDILRLSKYILATYGYDLLYEPKIRHLLFTLIENNRLKTLANRFTKKVYEKPYDNALALSLCPWKTGSELVTEVAKELNIPKEFLPLKTNSNQTVEIVEPIDKLFELHDYQKQLKTKILQELSNNTRRFLVQMPTGSGKTRTVIEALLEFIFANHIFQSQESIAWIAHTEELCEQAIDTYKDVWQNMANFPVQIIRCWGGYQPTSFDVLGSFVVGTFQKLFSLLEKKSDVFLYLKNSSRVVVVDEAHKAIAPSYARVINTLSDKKNVSVIGITATPGRGKNRDKENRRLARFFDTNLLSPDFCGNPILELRKKRILSNVNRSTIQTGIDVVLKSDDLSEVDDSFDLPGTIIRVLANNVERNRIILNVIIGELEKGNPCLVFSCSVEHSKLLSAAANYKGYNSAYIDCTMRKGSRKRIVDGFRKGDYDVLFNYGVLSTGFDAPRIRTIIITRPTASIVLYSQMIGRGLRGPLMGGTDVCNLIDIKDNYVNFGGVEEVYTFFEEYWQ